MSDEANNQPNTSFSVTQALGCAPIEKIDTGGTLLKRNETETDFEYAQRNIKDALAKGNAALEEMLQIAIQSQHSHAFEVFASLLKEVVGGNKALIEAKKLNSTIESGDKNERKTVTNNNVFVGSTKELQEFLNKKRDIDHE